MILGFKERFVGRILSGVKIHTIREDKNRRWSEGKTIHFATGVRTKKYKQFASGICTRIDDIIINPESKTININGSNIHGDAMEALRIRDGFDSMLEFWGWFDKPFSGRLIHFSIEDRFKRNLGV